MTITAPEMQRIRQEHHAHIAELREIRDLVTFLTPPDPIPGDVAGEAWWCTSGDGSGEDPTLGFGLGHKNGFLHWYTGNGVLVPDLVQYQGGEECPCYATVTGADFNVDPGEEIPVGYVYAAVLEFVATGERPKAIRWVPEVPVEQRPKAEATLRAEEEMRRRVTETIAAGPPGKPQ